MNSDGIEMDSLDLDARPPEQDFGEAFANMVGDADLGGGNGHIEIDRSIPHHPVIRFVDDDNDGEGAYITVTTSSANGKGATYKKVKHLTLASGSDTNIVFTGPDAYDETTGNLTLNIDVYYA